MRTEEEKAHSRLRTEMHAAFESNEILAASEETLQKYLTSLCTELVLNEDVRHREIIRALTINHIQVQRYIDKINRKNGFLQIIIIILTVAVLITAAAQTYTAVECAQQHLRFVQSQPTQQVPQAKSTSTPKIQGEATMNDLSISYQPPISPTKKGKADVKPKKTLCETQES